MEAIDDIASNIGYAVITAVVSLIAIYAVITWRPAYWLAKVLFLLAWGVVGIGAPIYSFVAITIPRETYISGTIGAVMVFLIGGCPFLYYGWPKLRQSLLP